jgi:hypothetical protein
MKFKKIIATLLVSALGLSMFTACTPSNNSSSNSGQTLEALEKRTYQGLHQRTAPERTDYFIQDGVCEYVIVMPQNPNKYEIIAKSELVLFFKQATGLNLYSITEPSEGFTHSPTTKYISIGNTKMFETTGIEIDESVLTTQGVRIVTKDNTIYLNGGSIGGALYATYTFLEIMFNWEIYAEDCWVIDENVRNLKMRAFDVWEVPDIEMRTNFWTAVQKNSNNIGYRFRMPDYQDAFIMPIGDVKNGGTYAGIHNSFDVLPKTSPYAEAEWYADDGQQLCYTAHGNEESYNRMIERIATVVTDCMKVYNPEKYPLFKFFTLTIQDGSMSTCVCDACMEALKKYGAHSGSIIVMCNRVMELVSAWQEKPENRAYKRDDFKMAFFAYHGYFAAPTHYDNLQDKIVPNHSDLIMRDDVAVYAAVSDNENGFLRKVSIYDDINKKGRDNLIGWSEIASELYLWTYQTNYTNYLAFSSTMNFYNTDGFSFLASLGVDMMANQGTTGSMNYTCFQAIKPYLDAKLQWNSSLDSDKLINDWFDAMYKDVAPLMKQLYLEEMQHDIACSVREGSWRINSGNRDASKAEDWPLNLAVRWLGMLDQAYVIAEGKYSKGDPETFVMIKNHIDMERVGPAYSFLVNFTEETAPVDLIKKTKRFFKETVTQMAPYQVGEGKGMLNEWIALL